MGLSLKYKFSNKFTVFDCLKAMQNVIKSLVGHTRTREKPSVVKKQVKKKFFSFMKKGLRCKIVKKVFINNKKKEQIANR